MHPFKNIAKRLFIAGSLLLVTACGSNGITEPSARKSGYLTVSASGYNVPAKPVWSTVSPAVSGYNVPAGAPVTTTTTVAPTTTTTTTTSSPKLPGTTTNSGYNVPAW